MSSLLDAAATGARDTRRRSGAAGSLHRVWRAVRRHPGLAVGGALLAAIVVVAIAAPWLGTIDPRALSPSRRLQPPSAQWWFGTDALGRDLYSRVLFGARVSLLVGASVALVSAVVGTAIGVVSAANRIVDAVVMRVLDGVMSIPAVLLAIALMAVAHGSILTLVAAIAVVEIPRVARLVRSVVLAQRELPYVEAAITCGATPWTIMVRHLLPATLAPLIVQATFIGAAAMIVEAILSFIGAGMPPTIPSWGNIMADGRALWQVKPFLVFIPAACLSLTVLTVNLVGDSLRDMLDPQAERRL